MQNISKTEDAILSLLKARGSLSAKDLARQLEMTAIGMRQHLKRMHEQGMIQPQSEGKQPKSAGRPALIWELSRESHNRFGDAHAVLTKELIEGARMIFGNEGVEKLVSYREQQTLSHYRAEMIGAETLADRVNRLVALRQAEGYMAEAKETEDGAGYLFIENHCPICAAATICQGFCRAELDVFRSILGEDVVVERAEYLLEGGRRCSYSILPKEKTDSSVQNEEQAVDKKRVSPRYLVVS
ncbi:winged helix-turn-helix transcriptional regulator [Kiloniella laminariae]|uniref:Winged helix-turn-helix transcriptional regulator n=1 Tax=Kiloniella laminariae TaxID=454162 RepID=A0ABT4LJF4_9PROT|nr:winged helix-turn-helix transcriptional regulator [Kiloniella laminariae]MCZ4281242.1 winged helix-turn-helix transcriptional regulator [Kiloniella laminariae]